jgi:predicted dienelactone hydrolase
MIKRSLEVNRAIDYAEALSGNQGQLAGMIDLDYVGVIGMSYGGYTAVMMAGVRPDFREAAAFCDQGNLGSPITQMVCQNYRDDLLGFKAHLIEVAGVDAEPGTLWPTLSDPRVDAVVAIVPGGGLSLIGTEGLAAAETPIMIMRATMDEVDLAEHNAARVWESISSTDKTLVTVENATHTFALYCSPEMEAMMGAACFEPEWDKAQLLDLTNRFVTRFSWRSCMVMRMQPRRSRLSRCSSPASRMRRRGSKCIVF